MLAPWKKSYNQPRQHIRKQRHYFINKGPSTQNYGFPSSHLWMWELEYKESWAPKKWCFGTVVLEKTLESPLDCQEIEPVSPKGNQPWICMGRNDAEAEAPILWPPDAKGHLIGKDSDAGKDWRHKEKGMRMTEDEMVGRHHRSNGHEFEKTPGDSEGQGSLACCSPWRHKELINWKRPWCWEILRAGGEGSDGGWDDWMALSTQWTWVWVNSRSWWCVTGRPGVLQFMGLQRVGHNWVSEMNWTD